MVIVAQRDDAGQHQEATYRSIQHELECRVNTAVAAPAADQEIGRYQHHFPENIEEEEVCRQEDANDATLQQQHEGHIVLDLLLDAERSSDTHECKEGGERNQQEANTIDAEAVVDAKRGNPGNLLVIEKRPVWRTSYYWRGRRHVCL